MMEECIRKKHNQDECATDRMAMFNSRKGVMMAEGC